jgi:hypothetical protein
MPTKPFLLILNTKPLVFYLWKLEPLNKIPVLPSVVQPTTITKLISPLKDGTSFKIIPLPVQTFIIPVPITVVVSKPMENSERSDTK